MPFYGYRVAPSLHFKLLHPVELASRNGPLPVFARKNMPEKLPEGQEGWGFHMTESALLGLLGLAPAEEHAILTGLKPHSKVFVEMYRLTDLWGYCYKTWTAVALRMKQLTDQNSQAPDPSAFTKGFKITWRFTEPVYEFRYLKGGLNEDAWTWGSAWSVNGVLLPEEAFRFFTRSMQAAGETHQDPHATAVVPDSAVAWARA